MKSIMSNEKVCYVCGSPNVHKHHIFYGTANRRLSEQYGCWCYLCPAHHNMSGAGVHFNKELDIQLKQECQRRFNDDERFIRIFGRNYM